MLRFHSTIALLLLGLGPGLRADRTSAAQPTTLGGTGKGAALEETAETWLTRLASGSALEREAAQRWLGLRLTAQDYPLLARHARDADAEVSRRLALALASEERHLELAVLLLGEANRTLVAIGEAAFEDLVTRWSPGCAGPPAERKRVQFVLDPSAEQRYSSPQRREEVEFTVERYARSLDFGVPLVLLPTIASREVNVDAIEGDCLELLGELCDDNGLTFSGIGDWKHEDEPGVGAWILVTPVSGARAHSGANRLARWCLSVETADEHAASSARALAACGWPAALEWLDRRWSRRGDANALEGLISAAALGRVAHSLQVSTLQVSLLQRADRALDSREFELDRLEAANANGTSPSRREAERIARALIGTGALARGGAASGKSWFEGWPELNNAQRWLRLFILGGRRSAGAAEREFVRRLVEGADTGPPALRFEALRALASLPPASDAAGANPSAPAGKLQPANLSEVIGWAIRSSRAEELLILLGALDVQPPGEFAEGGVDANWLEVSWWLSRRELSEATTALVRGVQRPGRLEIDDLVGRLTAWRSEYGPHLVEEVVGSALAELSDLGRERLTEAALMGECLDSRAKARVFEGLQNRRQLAASELEWLGALVVGPNGSAAEAKLLELLDKPPQDDRSRDGLARGLTHAVRVLRRNRFEERAHELIQKVWKASAPRNSPMHARLSPPGWPVPDLPRAVHLGQLEREIPAELF